MTSLLGLHASMENRGVNNVRIIKWYWRAPQISVRVSFHAGKIPFATTRLTILFRFLSCWVLWEHKEKCISQQPYGDINWWKHKSPPGKPNLNLCTDFFPAVWQVAGHAGLIWIIRQGRGTMRPSSACRCCIPVSSAPSLWPSKPRQCLASPHTGPAMSFKCEL